jgi:Fe-S cluster biogenesis protein NfuA
MSNTAEQTEIQVYVQATPNPYALKFICSREVKAQGKISYKSAEEVLNNELGKLLFSVPGVEQIHFFENVITITYSIQSDMFVGETEVIRIIKENLFHHDPTFKSEGDESERRAGLSKELQDIEEILDRTIRPGLRGDGGDLEVISYVDHQLNVRYQGACGTCPSSTTGTLMAIASILRDQFDPDIDVVPV